MSSIGSVSKPSMRTPHISFSDGLIGPRTCARPRARGPPLDRAQQRAGDVGVGCLEEPEHRHVVGVRLLMQPVVDGGDAADDAIAPPREHQLH